MTTTRPSFIRAHLIEILLLCGALAVRVALAVSMNPDFGDQREYLAGAARLLAGQPLAISNQMGFVRAPGYSVFIAMVWAVTPGRTLVAVRIVQAFISVGTCWLSYVLASRLTADKWAPRAALAISAGYPYFLWHVVGIQSECVFSFLLVLGVLLFAVAFRDDTVRWKPFFAAVVVWALAMLVRPNLSPIEAILGIALAFKFRKTPRIIAKAATVMVLGTLLVVLPWSLSVHAQGLGRVFVTDGGGIWYYVGHNDLAASMYCQTASAAEWADVVRGDWETNPVMMMASTLPRSEQQRLFWRSALAWDAQHLPTQVCLGVGKLWAFYRPWVDPGAYSVRMVGVSLTSLPLLICGFAGLWWSRKHQQLALTWIVGTIIIGGSLVAAIFSTQIRYRIPLVDVLLVPFAALFVAQLARTWLTPKPQ